MQDEVNIDSRMAMSVFDKITRLGIKSGDDWIFDQMKANAGFDGYSITLEDQHAKLTLNFHNTFHVDCRNHNELEQFVEHLKRIHHYKEPDSNDG